ncbi:AraC family transcriptional regulator [Paenibacillus sp. P26]|nr:AraC family transcriptional regulator [Paenibacillus sp. P26]
MFEGNEYEIRSGDVFIINPGEVHTYKIKPGKELEIINCLFMSDLIQGNMLLELGISQSMDYFYVHPFLDKRERFHSQLNLRGQEAAHVLFLLEAMMNEYDNRRWGRETLIRLQMVELLVLLSRYYSQRDGQAVRGAVRSNERRCLSGGSAGIWSGITIKSCRFPTCASCSTSAPGSLNRIFKEELNMTVFDMIHQIRIERAKHLLAETEEKVIVIAGKVGYEDPAFFSRLFQRSARVLAGQISRCLGLGQGRGGAVGRGTARNWQGMGAFLRPSGR